MKLKCIGGKCDGKWIEVNDQYRQHDLVTVPEDLKPLEARDFERSSYEDLMSPIALNYQLYKIELLKYNDNIEIKTFMFLIPNKANLWYTIVKKLES